MISYSRSLLALAAIAFSAPVAAQVPRLLPVPAELRAGQGAFAVSGKTALVVPAGDAGARIAAERFAVLIAQSRGLRLAIGSPASAASIRFVRAATGKAESYRLDVSPRGAVITAGDDAGLLYGAILDFSAWENMALGYHHRDAFANGPFIDRPAIMSNTVDKMQRFDVRPPDPMLLAKSFSGGNQQKVVVAREVESGPDLLLIGQPTRGVDIGAIEFIHKQIVALRDAG